MAGSFTATGGAAIFSLFEDPPNLVPQVVLESIRVGTNLVDGLVDMQINGYAKNAHNYYFKLLFISDLR